MSLSDSEGSDAVMVGPGDIRDFNKENILPLPTEDFNKIRGWLQPTPYDLERSEFSRHLGSYLVGTCQWLISTNTYQQWHEGDANGLLWIKGIPGSGKSVMAASIIDQLRKEDVPVLFFFFRQIIDANHQPVGALRDWLCQILPFSPPLQFKLKTEYLDNNRSIDSLATIDLWENIKFALSTFPKAYCITDALDEMDQGNDDFIQALAEFGQWRPANLKVLIFSRPVVAVESPLRPFSVSSLCLEEQLVDIDIAAYVQHRLQGSAVPKEYWNLITEAVPGRANGLFLYARLAMDAFSKPGADVKEVLKKLPADLNVMYNELLREHGKRSNVPGDLQLLILQSITHATRPLRLLEVAEMIKATHGPIGDRSLKDIKDLVRAACGPLLQILHDETVSVVHHSFTEFLKGFTRSATLDNSTYPILEAGPTNHRLAIACLDYLTSGCLDKLEIKKRTKSEEFFQPKKAQQSGIRLQFPFLEYAAANWYIHTRRAALAGIDLSSFYLVLDEFVANKQRFIAWLDIDWPENVIEGLTPLHAAAKIGLVEYAAHLIQNGDADPNTKSNRGDPPLYWAASSGHADIAKLLIDGGADPDGEAHEGYKPLHEAARKNRPEVVKILLAAGVDPLTPKTREAPGRRCGNAPTSVGHTPLMYACGNGHTKAVAEFLPYLTDPDAITKAIFWSAGSGRGACVDLILQHATVDVNSKYRGETLLFKACLGCDLNTIKILLAAGADPNIFCSYPSWNEFGGMGPMMMGGSGRSIKHPNEPRGYTALHGLIGIKDRHRSRLPSLECVSVLLQAGADIHLKSPDGKTALHFACVNNIDIVKLLLEVGADPYAEADNGETILHSDGSTDKELLPILFESGLVDVNKIMAKSNGGPLFSRLRGHHFKTALEFLKYKPNLNVTLKNGNGLLHVLFNHWGFDSKDAVLDAFLSAGADPNLQNEKGEAPLHLMGRETGVETISRLLKAGANLEIRDALGQTPLFKNVTYSNATKDKPELFKTLIELGARLDTRDNKGRTLLHQVVRNTDRLKELLGLMDFDPSLVDNKGNTLFLELASKKAKCDSISAYKCVKKIGVDIDQPNNSGKTVLHKLCSRKPRDRSWKPSITTLFDYVLHECKNPSPQDIDGIQPLHIAAAVSEAFVFKLLNAGADIFGVTKEGMTVLHIAARARQAGIIGLVLSKIADLDDEKRKAFINQRNMEESAALHYACSSCRPETVRLLLDAGADPNLPGKNGWTPFRACAEFEIEQARWNSIGGKDNTKVLKIASIWLGARSEPSVSAREDSEKSLRSLRTVKYESDSTRLDEILIDLISYGAKITGDNGSLRDAFHVAVSNQRDYTAECLVQLQSRFLPRLNLLEGSDGDGFNFCKARLEDMRSSLRKEEENRKTRKTTQRSMNDAQAMHMVKLLRRGEYVLLEEMMPEIDILMLNWQSISLPHALVRTGLSDLLDRVCTPEVASKFDDHEWCNQAEAANHCHRNVAKPLLIAACSREQPNMEVVRILVEKKGVNINLNCRKESLTSGKAVLHDLAEGATWWNVHQALPYLIGKGANLEQRNDDGETALHIALDFERYKGVFYKQAVKILLENGADVNAVNNKGETCLSKAGTDIELIKMLLSHGAKVSPAAIFSAIELGNVELLEFFLSQGDLANKRRPDPETPERIHSLHRTWIPIAQIYPLFHAATFKSNPRGPPENADHTPLRGRMMTALLKNGADPYATFVRLHRVNDNSFKDEEELNEWDENSEEKWNPETCTVIHEILRAGDVVEPLLQLPSLQVESRDDQGCTLIHCTCGNERIWSLIDRGADISAQDNSGKTIVHRLVQGQPSEQKISTIRDLLTRDPRLVHMSDEAGDTPFHYVIRARDIQFEYIDLLLEHGAEPVQPDSEGNTALHFLATKPFTHKERIQQFLNHGLDINSRNTKGNTPLSRYLAHSALRPGGMFWRTAETEARSDNDGLLFFKDLGADFLTTNNSGTSLLHVVAGRKVGSRGYFREDELKVPIENLVQWFKYLMDMGLDPMLEDAQQRTSLDVAAACGNEHILKLFKEKNTE
ncbi:uncharacterized protein N7496_008937 [Penicillium cataractarum]|uniref:Nephrocystin 3-like N-terminal domain-containing protein n=1 Tax=Penicillium cataractarum TaxID=2100454 RepID=A0A9W9V575_9EURO|nr:uncharacterized protein N7496_008937 [Penicillium cataractarum]KAJ5369177.1 hypothetical protein N7496_008937 [Penicillium cataractarum]